MIPQNGPVDLKKDPSIIYIAVFVVLAHLFCGIFAVLSQPEQKPLKKKQPLLVKTVQLKERKAAPSPKKEQAIAMTFEMLLDKAEAVREEERPAPDAQAKEEPAPKKNVSTAKKETPAPIEKKDSKKKPAALKKEKPKETKPVKKKEPVKKKNPVPPENEIKKENEKKKAEERLNKCLKDAKERIAKIDKNRDNVNAFSKKHSDNEVKTAKLIGSLNVDLYGEDGSQQDFDYTDELAYALKRNLKLPEYGTVDIMLQLSSKGDILKFKVERAKSSLNKAYVESHLPKIKFAPFSGAIAKKPDYTFRISLTNDE